MGLGSRAGTGGACGVLRVSTGLRLVLPDPLHWPSSADQTEPMSWGASTWTPSGPKGGDAAALLEWSPGQEVSVTPVAVTATARPGRGRCCPGLWGDSVTSGGYLLLVLQEGWSGAGDGQMARTVQCSYVLALVCLSASVESAVRTVACPQLSYLCRPLCARCRPVTRSNSLFFFWLYLEGGIRILNGTWDNCYYRSANDFYIGLKKEQNDRKRNCALGLMPCMALASSVWLCAG
jgi:hypothetical protein